MNDLTIRSFDNELETLPRRYTNAERLHAYYLPHGQRCAESGDELRSSRIYLVDHDLGTDREGNLLPTGYDFAKWLIEMDMDGIITIPPDFAFTVHSANPVGAKNIQGYLMNYLQRRKIT